MKIKLSTLRNTRYVAVENRKSKGKLNFIDKIKYLYLLFIHKKFGLDVLETSELNEYIEILNKKNIVYDKQKLKLENKNQQTDEKFSENLDALSYEREIEEEDYKDELEIADSKHEMVNKKLNEVEENIDKVQNSIAEAKQIIDKREMLAIEDTLLKKADMYAEEAVSSNNNKVENILDNSNEEVEEKTELSEETFGELAEAIKETSSQVNKITSLDEMQEEKEETNVNNDVDTSEEKDENMDYLENFFSEIKNHTEAAKSDAVKSVESNIETVYAEMAKGVTLLFKNVVNDLKKQGEEAIGKVNDELDSECSKNAVLTQEKEDLSNALDETNKVVSDRDKEIEELKATIAARDSEIASQKEQIENLNSTISDKDVEISNLTAENKNYKTTVRTLLSTKASEMENELEEEAKVK